jgi:hypothetical protein
MSRSALFLLLFGVACVLVPGMFWWGTTFSRRLADSVLAEQLGPEARPRDIQHAIEEISHRFEEGRPGMDRWAAELVRISSHTEAAVRVSAAWCMQFDAHREVFVARLREMVADDPSVMVRRNAATSLAKSGDAAARPVLREMLEPYPIAAGVSGRVESILAVDLAVEQGQLVARIALPDDATVGDDTDDEEPARYAEVRSPIPGTVTDTHVTEGDEVAPNYPLAHLAPSMEHLRNAILGLALVGTSEDASVLKQIADPRSGYPDEIRTSAAWAADQVSTR